MTTTTITPSVQTGTKLTELERYKKLNAELWESIRQRDAKIILLENAMLSVRGIRKKEIKK